MVSYKGPNYKNWLFIKFPFFHIIAFLYFWSPLSKAKSIETFTNFEKQTEDTRNWVWKSTEAGCSPAESVNLADFSFSYHLAKHSSDSHKCGLRVFYVCVPFHVFIIYLSTYPSIYYYLSIYIFRRFSTQTW